jgi:hypothetical protein
MIPKSLPSDPVPRVAAGFSEKAALSRNAGATMIQSKRYQSVAGSGWLASTSLFVSRTHIQQRVFDGREVPKSETEAAAS